MPRKQGHGRSADRSRNQNNQRMSAQRQSQSGQAENVDEEMPASSSAPASAAIAARRVLFSAADEDVRAAGADDLCHALFSGECGLPILTLPAFYDCSPIHPLLLSAIRAYSYSLPSPAPIHPFLLSALREHGWQPRACRPAWWTWTRICPHHQYYLHHHRHRYRHQHSQHWPQPPTS